MPSGSLNETHVKYERPWGPGQVRVHLCLRRGTASSRLEQWRAGVCRPLLEVADIKAREADRTRELAEQGHLVRLWTLPPTPGSLSALLEKLRK